MYCVQLVEFSSYIASMSMQAHTWTHSWVCLFGTGDESVPDATEQVTLVWESAALLWRFRVLLRNSVMF